MGYAIETVGGSYAAAAVTGAQAYTAAPGQSFSVRAAAPGANIAVEAVWTKSLDAGFTRIRSPRLHDDVNGIKLEHYVGNASPIGLEYFSQPLYSQDILLVEDFFTAAPTVNDVQQVGFSVYYDDLPGAAANYWSWAQVKSKIRGYYGVAVSPVSNATVGQWGPGVALNSTDDQFQANSLYALIGYVTPTLFTAFTIQGPDTSNYQVGGPGSVDPLITRRWFAYMEEESGKPSIPVINSQNKVGTIVSVLHSVASTTFPISLLFAWLGPVGS